MKHSEGARHVGRVGLLPVRQGLTMWVRATDARRVFDRVDVFVEPVNETGGCGGGWVAADSVLWHSNLSGDGADGGE